MSKSNSLSASVRWRKFPTTSKNPSHLLPLTPSYIRFRSLRSTFSISGLSFKFHPYLGGSTQSGVPLRIPRRLVRGLPTLMP
jgi:hypothetical protein